LLLRVATRPVPDTEKEPNSINVYIVVNTISFLCAVSMLSLNAYNAMLHAGQI
jgi:hypothetical protein